MNRNIFFTLLLLLSLNFNSALATERMARIIGGRTADSSAWPWMAGLIFKRSDSSHSFFCGASLIAENWVLTAAHCVFYKNRLSFDVIINQAQLENGNGERLSVDDILIHPQYNPINFENDLALIKLATPSHNPPINVLAPFSTQDYAGKVAIALGWGTTSDTPLIYPQELQQVDLPIIDNSRCAVTMGGNIDTDDPEDTGDITTDMLCAGDGLGRKDTCFGDSGGPLIVFDTESRSWRQAGITSWGYECASPGFFGVYTRLKNYAAFISEHICTAQDIPEPVSLSLDIDDTIATASWNTLNTVSGYRLNYAPYPDAQTIYSMDMNRDTDFSATLGSGDAFYVAMTSYNGNCLSEYSNIEHFIIK